jgi:hypothetical protein
LSGPALGPLSGPALGPLSGPAIGNPEIPEAAKEFGLIAVDFDLKYATPVTTAINATTPPTVDSSCLVDN